MGYLRDSRHAKTLAVGTFLGLVQVWYWWRLFTTPGVLAHSDLYEQFLPVFLSPITAWSSTEFGGLPLLADPQNTTWYPLHLLFSRAIGSWSGYVVSAYVVAALGAGAYAWQVTRSRVAALAAGLAWPWSEALADMFPHLAMLHGFAWMPWVLFGVEKVAETPRPAWIAATAFWFACLGLSGHPQVSVYGAYLGLAYATTLWFANGRRRDLLVTFGAVFALGGALCAVQVIPTLEVSSWIARDRVGFAQFADSFAKKPHELMTILVPQFCHERREAPSYTGLATLWMAVVAVAASGREWRVRFWMVVAVVGLLLGLGSLTPLARIAYELPLYDKFRVVARHLVLYSFAVIALGALGIRALRDGRLSMTRGALIGGLTTCVALAGLLFVSRRPDLFMVPCDTSYGFSAFMPGWLTPLRVQATLAMCGGLLVALGASRPGRRFALGAVPLVLAVDLLNAHSEAIDLRGLQPPTIISAGLLQPSVHAVALRDQLAPAHQRLLALEGSALDPVVPGAFARLWNIPILGGYNPLLPDRLTRLAQIEANGAMRPRGLLSDNGALDLFAVRYAIVRVSELAALKASPADTPLDDLPALDIVIGPSDCQPRGPMSLTLSTPPVEAIGVVLVSELRCGDNIADDTMVGAITVAGGGKAHAVRLKAGVSVAQAGGDVLFVQNRDRPEGTDLRAVYRGSFSAPVAAEQLTIETSSMPASMYVERLALVAADGRLVPIALPQAALGPRWREHARFSTSRNTDRGADGTGRDEQEYVVLENLKAQPRAWFVGNVVEVADERAVDTIRFSRTRDGASFDVAHSAIVAPGTAANTGGGTGRVDIDRVAEGRFELTAETSSAGLVVLSELHHPEWQATVDGARARIVRADYAVMGVEVPAGRHQVVFEFSPRSAWLGAAVSLAACAVMIACFVDAIRRRRGSRAR